MRETGFGIRDSGYAESLRRLFASRTRLAFSLALAVLPLAVHAQDDDDDAAKNASGTTPTLNREQREAVGIVVAHAVKAKPAERIAAFGQVLDPSTLITELGEVDANRAAERAASAEVARLQGLYKAGAGASLKNLEAAQAEQARTHAQAEAAATRFALRWAPLATGANARRQKIIDAVAAGRSALVRVDLPGQHSIGEVPQAATIDIDGVAVKGAVLGALAQASEAQSASLLVEIESAAERPCGRRTRRGFARGRRARRLSRSARRADLRGRRRVCLSPARGEAGRRENAVRAQGGDAADAERRRLARRWAR